VTDLLDETQQLRQHVEQTERDRQERALRDAEEADE
jgi:hypothetical protein